MLSLLDSNVCVAVPVWNILKRMIRQRRYLHHPQPQRRFLQTSSSPWSVAPQDSFKEPCRQYPPSVATSSQPCPGCLEARTTGIREVLLRTRLLHLTRRLQQWRWRNLVCVSPDLSLSDELIQSFIDNYLNVKCNLDDNYRKPWNQKKYPLLKNVVVYKLWI